MVILVLLTFFRAIAAGETRYIFHLILMSKVRLENKFCEKSDASPRTYYIRRSNFGVLLDKMVGRVSGLLYTYTIQFQATILQIRIT